MWASNTGTQSQWLTRATSSAVSLIWAVFGRQVLAIRTACETHTNFIQWTSSVLEKHDGFEPMALYPGYTGMYSSFAQNGSLDNFTRSFGCLMTAMEY
jgi:hypothetical protein